jgi:hypothetical protein
MPRIALVCLLLVGACRFDADYTGATVRCSDEMCPAGLECREVDGHKVCLEKRMDAAIDMPADTMGMDADGNPGVALTCVDPGILTSGQPVSGNTTPRMNLMTSFCGGGVQNAYDAVYRITTTAPNKQLLVSINSSLSAYVLNACMQTPNTAACLGSNPANQGNPINVAAAAAGNYWVVVDNLNAGIMGPYTLTVTIQ